MASPLNKNKEELTLYLIEESYKVYKANFAGSRDFEAPIPRYRDRNPPLESLPPGTDFFSRNPDIPPPPLPPPPPSLPDPIKTPAKKIYSSVGEWKEDNLYPPAREGYIWKLSEDGTHAKEVPTPWTEYYIQSSQEPREIKEKSKQVILKPVAIPKETLKKKKAFFDFNPEKAQRQELAKEQSLLLSVETQRKKENIESTIETIEIEIAEPIVNEENVYNLLNYLNEEFSKINLFPKAFIENISSEIPNERQLVLPEEKEKIVENISLAKKEFILSEENFVDLLSSKINQLENVEELFELEENEFLRNDLVNYKLFNDKELYSLTILLYSLNSELSLLTLNNILQINSYYYIKEEKTENLFFLSEIVIKEEELLSGIKYKPIILKDNTTNKEINLSLLIQEYITDLLKSDFKIIRQANIKNNLSDDEKKEAIKTILDEIVEIGKKEAAYNLKTVSTDINKINLTKGRIKTIIEEGILWEDSLLFTIEEKQLVKDVFLNEENEIVIENYENKHYFLDNYFITDSYYFNWCGCFIAYCYKDFIKKEIRKKFLASTYRFASFCNNTKRSTKINSIVLNATKNINLEIFKIKNSKLQTEEEKNNLINKKINEEKEKLDPFFKKGTILTLNPTAEKWYGTHFALLKNNGVKIKYIDYYSDDIKSYEEKILSFFVDTIEGNTVVEEIEVWEKDEENSWIESSIDVVGVKEKERNLINAVAVHIFLPEDYNLEFQGKVKQEYNNAEIIIKDPLT